MSYGERDPRPLFDERKTTEAALYLLKRAGGEMYFIQLLKLLYIADRVSILRWKEPITHDQYVSMDNGPVLSRTYRIINETYDESSVWRTRISERFDHKIKMLNPLEEADPEWLSDSELEILDEVFSKFGDWDRWALCEYTHTFPEWEDPHGSMVPFTLSDILLKAGREADIKTAHQMISAQAYLRRLEKGA